VAALGLVIGALVVASLSLRKSRRVRVRELRQAERDLTDKVAELERENRSLRGELARRDPRQRRPAAAGVPADRPPDPIYDETRRAARLRGSDLEP
jgi:hypothetical protein